MNKLIFVTLLSLPLTSFADEKPEVPICNKPTKDASFAACQNAVSMGSRVADKLEDIYRHTGAKVAILSRLSSRNYKMDVLVDMPASIPGVDRPQDFITFINSDAHQNLENLCSDATNERSEAKTCVKKTIQKAFHKDPNRKMKYFHSGFAVRYIPEGQTKPRWIAIHELKPEGSNRADICEQDLPLFYLDELDKYTKPDSEKVISTLITIPTALVRHRLEQILRNQEKTRDGNNLWLQLKSSDYNATAMPFQQGFKNKHKDQNSNQWILEVLAASQTNFGTVQTRTDAQNVLYNTGYMPTKIKLRGKSKHVRTLAKFKGNVSLKKQAFKGYKMGEIISSLSIHEYLQKRNLVQYQEEIIIPRAFTVLKTSKRKCGDTEYINREKGS